MKLYIAGPMTGLPDSNFPLFLETARRLRAAGFDVACPAEGVPDSDRAQAQDEGDQHQNGDLYRGFMRRGISTVMECDGVCTLTGWQHSKGATAELTVADVLKLEVGNTDYWLGNPPRELKYTGYDAFGPSKAYPGDAGFDLYVSEETRIKVNGFADVPLGINVQLPPGTWAMLTGRSSTIRTRGLLVTQGVIDNGYTGPLYAGVKNLSGEIAVVKKSERIAQLIPFRLEPLTVRQVVELTETDRGTNGFGSTGT